MSGAVASWSPPGASSWTNGTSEPIARPSESRLPRRPIAGRDESKPSHRPIYGCKWGRAPYRSLGGAGRGPHLSRRRTPLDAAPEAGAGGVPGERARVVRSPASFVLFRSVLSQGRGEHRSANRRQGRWFGGGVGLSSASRRRRWPRASRIDRAADGRLAGDGRWAASGGYGDCDGSDSGGAGSAGEARGRAGGRPERGGGGQPGRLTAACPRRRRNSAGCCTTRCTPC